MDQSVRAGKDKELTDMESGNHATQSHVRFLCPFSSHLRKIHHEFLFSLHLQHLHSEDLYVMHLKKYSEQTLAMQHVSSSFSIHNLTFSFFQMSYRGKMMRNKRFQS